MSGLRRLENLYGFCIRVGFVCIALGGRDNSGDSENARTYNVMYRRGYTRIREL